MRCTGRSSGTKLTALEAHRTPGSARYGDTLRRDHVRLSGDGRVSDAMHNRGAVMQVRRVARSAAATLAPTALGCRAGRAHRRQHRVR